MATLSIVIPLFNEEQVVEKFYAEIKTELAQIQNYSHQILFVVDGDGDATAAILRSIAHNDPAVSVIIFSKNFGHQMALLAGIDHASGNAVIMMDGDLQHPPSLIPKLIAEFETGADVVHAIRKDTDGINLRRALASTIFYRLMNMLSDTPILEGSADFRLISRRIVEIVRHRIRERNLFIRGIVSWVGFRQASVSYTAAKRAGGASKYSILKLIRFAFSGAISFSRKPLRVASFAGALAALGGFFFVLLTLGEYFFGTPFPAGWATVVILLAIFGGLQLMFLGIIGEYIGAIFDEVKARPHYLVAETINLETKLP